ncbi:GGDEF domain-containing phosphodiesterase [Gymnodinialimonas ceratoperidinii]|uniref:GGDEF domain-containing phosphodiesterase n=1 Tax=Gymnodinialimonas ceratoperidinii TaxID=2856823 RepID=A0A8F6TW91_9RHOB|nr:GGDEF domain-containing phosphodiesterase [Gymnodinialimonas ceratoperidinii]QXT39613.1 GGDEF domain-containing phosphodiesterase [Gymnodinialimonas ceratoperidinii]
MAELKTNGAPRATPPASRGRLYRIAQRVRLGLDRVEVLALFPLIALTATWFGFDDLALVTAVVLSALLAIGGLGGRPVERAGGGSSPAASGRTALVAMLDRVANLAGRDTACFLIQIDDWSVVLDRWGHDASEDIARRLEERLQTALRNGDLLTRLGDSRFGVVLSPLSSARLGLRDTIATRLADAVAEPLPLRGTGLRLTASIGHSAVLKQGADPADATFKAAEAALGEAVLNGPAATRAFAPGMGRARALQTRLSEEVEAAIHDGAIQAWFQPQVHAKTSALSGMETLARWQHPKHGLLGPKEFFPAVEASGQMPLLGQRMLHEALKALRDWDKLKAHIPTISVNFSVEELRDPALAEGIASEVARYGLTPNRVVIQVSDDVATQIDDDAVVATLQTLRDAGHRLDLEGFGIGAASIPTLQRLSVTRITIDRGFVLDVDVALEKRQAVSAITALAKAMGIETLASGVETQTERDALAQLGCDFLQGFGVAHPMGLENVADWARAHEAAGKTIRLEDRRAQTAT